MEIFKWVKDIENIYEDLIEKAKRENLSELQALRNNQEKIMEYSLSNKQELVNSSLKILSEEVKDEIKKYENHINKIIKNIEETYQKNKENLKTLIIEKLGLEF